MTAWDQPGADPIADIRAMMEKLANQSWEPHVHTVHPRAYERDRYARCFECGGIVDLDVIRELERKGPETTDARVRRVALYTDLP